MSDVVDNVLNDALVVQSEPGDLPGCAEDELEKGLADDHGEDTQKAPSEFDILKEDEECPWGRMGQRHWILLALFLGMCCQYVQRSCIVRDGVRLKCWPVAALVLIIGPQYVPCSPLTLCLCCAECCSRRRL